MSITSNLTPQTFRYTMQAIRTLERKHGVPNDEAIKVVAGQNPWLTQVNSGNPRLAASSKSDIECLIIQAQQECSRLGITESDALESAYDALKHRPAAVLGPEVAQILKLELQRDEDAVDALLDTLETITARAHCGVEQTTAQFLKLIRDTNQLYFKSGQISYEKAKENTRSINTFIAQFIDDMVHGTSQANFNLLLFNTPSLSQPPTDKAAVPKSQAKLDVENINETFALTTAHLNEMNRAIFADQRPLGNLVEHYLSYLIYCGKFPKTSPEYHEIQTVIAMAKEVSFLRDGTPEVESSAHYSETYSGFCEILNRFRTLMRSDTQETQAKFKPSRPTFFVNKQSSRAQIKASFEAVQVALQELMAGLEYHPNQYLQVVSGLTYLNFFFSLFQTRQLTTTAASTLLNKLKQGSLKSGWNEFQNSAQTHAKLKQTAYIDDTGPVTKKDWMQQFAQNPGTAFEKYIKHFKGTKPEQNSLHLLFSRWHRVQARYDKTGATDVYMSDLSKLFSHILNQVLS